MIDKLNTHYSMTNPASVYDEEALTSLELVGRTTAKVNEVVNAQNQLKQETEEHLDTQDSTIASRLEAQDNRLTKQETTQIPQTVTREVQKNIDSGTFDGAIDKYAGNLESRMDNLLGSMLEGSTTMDAEVIDIRTGADNRIYGSAGSSVRSQFEKVYNLMGSVNSYRNLADKNRFTRGYYMNVNGVPMENPSYFYTHDIFVEAGQRLVSGRTVRFLTAYDSLGNPVESAGVELDNERLNYVVPEGVSKVVLTGRTGAEEFFSVNVGLFPLVSGSPYKGVADYVKKENVEGYLGLIKESDNLANEDYFIMGSYVYSDGATGANDTLFISVVSDVSEGETIWTNASPRFVVFFDVNGEFLSGKDYGGITTLSFNAPENAGYIVMTHYSTDMTGLMVNKGEALKPYERGGVVLNDGVLPAGITTLNLELNSYLPERIIVASGRTVEIYNNQVILPAEKYHFRHSCDIGHSHDRKYVISATDEMIGEHVLTISVTDDNMEEVWGGVTTIEVVPSVISANTDVVCLGDSWTNGKPWLAELITLSNGKLNLKGHFDFSCYDSEGNLVSGGHEGRSGFSSTGYWTGAGYLHSDVYGDGDELEHTIFWNETAASFDWSHYVTNYLNGDAPDVVVILLGVNGLSPDNTNPVLCEKNMVDNILSTYPDTKIVVVTPAFEGTQSGFGNKGNNGVVKHAHDTFIVDIAKKLEDAFKNYGNVTFCPLCSLFDSVYGYPLMEVPIFPRSTMTEIMQKEAVHPSDEGYYAVADVIYSAICKALE